MITRTNDVGASVRSSRSRPTKSATACGAADSAAARPVSTARRTNSANAVERRINRLKQRRGLATRTDKLAIAYQAALHVAGILIWTRRWPKRQNLGEDPVPCCGEELG